MGTQISRLINQPEIAGAEAYKAAADKVTKANEAIANSGKQAADGLGATEQASKRTDQALSGRATGIEALNRKYLEGYRAQKEYERALTSINKQLESGIIKQDQANQLIAGAQKYHLGLTQSVEKATGAIKLQGYQMTNLSYQIQDAAVQLQGGQNPFTILVQQAPQAAGAVGGFSNLYKLAMQSILSPTGLAVIGIGALVGAMALIGSRAADLARESREFGVALRGMGRDAEVTTAQLNKMVEAMRDQGVSKADARGVLTSAIRSPGLSSVGVSAISSLAADFAAGSGQDVQAAAKALTDGLTGGYTAAMKLADAYKVLSPTQKETIRQLYETGRSAEASSILLDAMNRRFVGLAEASKSTLGLALKDLGRAWDDLLTRLAGSEATIAIIQKLADALNYLAKSGQPGGMGGGFAAGATLKGQINLKQKFYDDAVADLERMKANSELSGAPRASTYRGLEEAQARVDKLGADLRNLKSEFANFGQTTDDPEGRRAGNGSILGGDLATLGRNSTSLDILKADLAARQRLIGAGAAGRAIGEADLKTAQTIRGSENPYSTDEEATLKALNRKEALIGLQDAIARTTALSRIDSAETLKVADAYMKSESAGAEAMRQRQAAADAFSDGVSKEVRAVELRNKAINDTITSSSQSLAALRMQSLESQRGLSAARDGAEAQREAATANKVYSATMAERLALVGADVEQTKRLNELIAEKTKLIKEATETDRLAQVAQKDRAADDEIELASLQKKISLIGDINERRAAEVSLARRQQEIRLRDDSSLEDSDRSRLLSKGDQARALQDNARFNDEVRQQADELSKDVSQFLVDGFVNANKGGKSAFQNLWEGALAGAKRFAAQIAATFLQQQILMPIAMQVVGGSPGTFGIAGSGGASSGGGFSLPNLGGTGFGSSITNSINNWGATNLGTASSLGSTIASTGSTSAPALASTFIDNGLGGVSSGVNAATGGSLGSGVTLTQGLGAVAGIGGGIYQMVAGGGSAGSIVGGASSMAAGLMSLSTAAGPYAPLVAVGGMVLSSLLGGKKPSVGPGGGIGFGVGEDGKAKVGWSVQDNGYDPVGKNQAAADAIGAGAVEFFKKVGGTFKGTGVSDRGAELGYDAGLKKYVGGDDTSGGKGRYDTLEQAMAASLIAVVKNSIVDGVSKDIQDRIRAVNTSQDMENLLLYISGLNQIYDAFKGWTPPLTAAEQAMNQLNASFEQAKSAAESLSKSTDDLKSSYEKQKAYLIGEFNAPLLSREKRAKGFGLEADLLDFDRQAAETRKAAAALGGEAIVQAEKTLVAERLRIQLGYMEQAKSAEESRLAPLRSTYNSLISELQNMRNVWKGIAEQMIKFRDSLKVGPLSTLSPEQQMLEAQRQYESTLAKARGGDATAAGELQGYAQSALQQTQSYYASGAGYGNYFNKVQSDLTDFAGYANEQVSIADQALGIQKDTLSAVRTIAQIMQDIENAKRALTNAGASVGGVSASGGTGLDGGGFGNGALSTEQNISSAYKQFWGRDAADWEVKAWTDLIGSGKASASGAFASIQFAPQASEYQASIAPPLPPRTMTDLAIDLSTTNINDALKLLPKFASGGDFGGGFRVVGESGPEIEATGRSRIFSFEQSRRLFSGGNDNSAVAEMRALRAEVAQLKEALVQATYAGAGGVIKAVQGGSDNEAKIASAQARQASAPSRNAA
jgi:hypothetical protein